MSVTIQRYRTHRRNGAPAHDALRWARLAGMVGMIGGIRWDWDDADGDGENPWAAVLVDDDGKMIDAVGGFWSDGGDGADLAALDAFEWVLLAACAGDMEEVA